MLAHVLADPHERVAESELSTALSQRIAEREPTIINSQQRLAGELHNLGMYLFEIDKEQVALEKVRRAISIQRELAQEHPNSESIHAFLANHWSQLSEMHLVMGKESESLEALELSLNIRNRVVEIQPDDIYERYLLTRTHTRLGERYQQGGQHDRAFDHYQKASAIMERIQKDSNLQDSQASGSIRRLDLAKHRLELANLHAKKGSIYRSEARTANALTSLREAKVILIEISDAVMDETSLLESFHDQTAVLVDEFQKLGQRDDASEAAELESLAGERLAEIAKASKANDAVPETASVADAGLRDPTESLVRFDGNDRLILRELDADLEKGITVEAWLQIEGQSPMGNSGNQIISVENLSAPGCSLEVSIHPDFYWHLGAKGGSARHVVPAPVKRTPALTHVAIVITPEVFRFFLDGELLGTRKVAGLEVGEKWDVFLGGSKHRPKFVGLMDEFRFSNAVRYVKTFRPARVLDNDDKTLALYHFDTNPENIAYDASSRANSLSLDKAKWATGDDWNRLFGPPPTREPSNDAALGFLPKKVGRRIHWPRHPVGGQLTFECWIQPRQAAKSNADLAVFSMEFESFQDAFGVYIDPVSHLYMKADRNGEPIGETDRTKIALNAMTHVAVVKDAEKLSLFVDGKRTGDLDIQPYTMRGAPICRIGRNNEGDGFVGILDEIRASDKACYSETFQPTRELDADKSTILLLHFDRNKNGIAYDYSGNDWHTPMISPRWELVKRNAAVD